MSNENYTPYGEEWKKEMQKLPKKLIIDLFAKTGHDKIYLAEAAEHRITKMNTVANSTKGTLSELISAYQQIEELLADNGGELTEEIEAMISDNQQAIEEKLDAYAGMISHIKGQEDWLKASAKKLNERARAFANARENMRERMTTAMQITGNDKIRTTAHSYSLRTTESWAINDDNFANADLNLLIEHGAGERTYKVDMTKLKALVEDGKVYETVPDYVTVTTTTSINIR